MFSRSLMAASGCFLLAFASIDLFISYLRNLDEDHIDKTEQNPSLVSTDKLVRTRSPGKSTPSPKHNVRGTNLFFHEVTSGTCASNGLESIVSKELCILAADYHGFKYYSTTENDNAEAHDLLEGCFMEPQQGLPFEPSGFLSGLNKNLIVSVNETCKPMKTDCQCTMQKPCFCTSKNFVQRNRDNPYGRRMNMNGQFVVNWALSLGEYDSLLENTFLRAAFEQSVKDYINNDIFCSDDPAAKGAEFFGVEIPEPAEDKEGKLMAISGNGKCKGDFTKCKLDLKKAKKPKRIGEHATGEARLVKATDVDDDFCEVFKNQTVFDAFKEKLLMASAFNYAVDVDVINDLEGSIDLSYDVSFEPAPSEGLDQVDSVDMAAADPDPVDPVCTDSQCSTQEDVMRNIFSYFDIPIDGDKHECLYQGINCNNEDLVTHIWMVNYGFEGKTLPDLFGSLTSLEGLFFGGNQLSGTIPSNFGQLRALRLLWLENNSISGTIPSNLGNLRGLRELNLFNNTIGGSIPTSFAKLKKLRMLNIGENMLTGSIPTLVIEPPTSPNEGCSFFPNPFNRIFKIIDFTEFTKAAADEIEGLVQLETLNLANNLLGGSIPGEFELLESLADFNVAENQLTGTLSTGFENWKSLNLFDVHKNSLTGSIFEEIGNLGKLKIVNLHDNELSGSIPPDIGLLSELEELVLDENHLTGPIPPQLGNLVDLVYLTFGNNSMVGEIPTELGNLKKINNLDLRGYTVGTQVGKRFVSGSIPTELGNMKAWKYVVFEDNGAAGGVPSEFGNLESSEAMWLKNQQLSGTMPTEIANIGSTMSLLSVGNNQIEGTMPSILSTMSGLAQLDIGTNSITGAIPTEFGEIAGLEYIALGSPDVSGTMPSELGQLSNLQYLNIDDTQMTGSLPSELGNLNSLKSLGIAGGSFTGTLPTEIGIVSGMQRLDFANNGFTGTIPSEVGNMGGILEIDLSNNFLTGQIPTELSKLDNLQSINLVGNMLTGEIPSELALVPTLDTIELRANEFTGTIPIEIASKVGLKVLSVGSNQMSGTIHTEFGAPSSSFRNLTQDQSNKHRRALSTAILETLDIQSNSFTGTIPEELGSILTLIDLSLSDNQITGTIPTSLGNLGALNTLSFGSNQITGTIPTEFGMLNVATLDLAGNAITGPIPTELGNIGGLAGLLISGNALTGSLPTELGQLSNLATAAFGDNDLSGSIPTELGALASLSNIDLAGNGFTGNIPSELSDLGVDVNLDEVVGGISLEEWQVCYSPDYVYDPENSSQIYCNNYCGSPDEECNSEGIGNATCPDKGCSGEGLPSCTAKCKLDYSTCNPGADEIGIKILTKTDSKGYETSWEITRGNVTFFEEPQIPYKNENVNFEYQCLPNDCYTFTILDSGGDGICCAEGDEDNLPGWYRVWINEGDGLVQETTPRFESQYSIVFGTCTSPTASPTKFPTGSPSSAPSSAPTETPSISSSSAPSSAPSETISTSPSSVPSNAPTVTSSSAPSETPSTSPSSAPSNAPTITASSAPSETPSTSPSSVPSNTPSETPSTSPSSVPSNTPSLNSSTPPSSVPSSAPSRNPSTSPSLNPSNTPSLNPSTSPSAVASPQPTLNWFAEIDNPGDVGGFGTTVAIRQISSDSEDSLVFISNYNESSGMVYVFNVIDNVPSLSKTLNVSDFGETGEDGDQFGFSIAVSSQNVYIGANNVDDGIGKLYVYSFPDLTIETTIEGDGTVEEGFGSALSCSEDIITVGAPGFNTSTGKVYVYDATVTTFDIISSFVPDETDANTSNGRFGFDLTVKGERIFVGAPGYSNDKGRVYIYDAVGNFIFGTGTTGLDDGDNFGHSMTASSSRFVIGAPFSNTTIGIQGGAAYEYELSNPDQVNELVDPTPLSVPLGANVGDGSCFGFSTAFLGNIILVSAPQIKNGALVAEIYYYLGNNVPIAFPHPADENIGDQFAYDMTLNGGLAIVGAPGSDDGLGRAYFIRVQDYLAQ